MVDHAGVVSINVFLAENGVLLPLDSIEEVKTLGERLKTDKDFRGSLVQIFIIHLSS
jgi:hypothetical protein